MNSDVTVSLNSNQQTLCHNCHAEDWNVTLAFTGLETKKGGRIKMVAPYLGDERFLLTYGDGVSDVDINKLIQHHEQSGSLVTFTGVHPISRYATVEQDDTGRIIDWNEKKRLEGYINGGFFVVEPQVLNYITGDVEFEEEPMKQLAREGKVSMFRHDGFWHCMDTFRDYLHLTQLWDNGRAPWKVW